MAPPVSALVVNFNTGELLRRCVASLQESAVTEVLVGDNGSTDQSMGTLGKLPKLRLRRFGSNLGFGKAVNRLAQEANGEYLLIANPDIVVDPSAISALVRALQEAPDAMIAGGLISNVDGTPQRAMRRRRPTPMRSLVTAMGMDHHLSGVNVCDAIPECPEPVFGVSGALLLVRKEDWQVLGGFDEAYFLHCEDLDLFARIADDYQRTCLFVPAARAIHEHGACHRGVRLRSAFHKWRGMRRYYWTHEAKKVHWILRWAWPAALSVRLAMQIPALWIRDRKVG